jgi:spermidine synthase
MKFIMGRPITLNKWIKILLVIVVFISAFLLFVSEPLIGRLMLPFLGGAVQNWLICLMFFQAMLLLGYLYAHLLTLKMRGWHLLLLLFPLINLPFRIGIEQNSQDPILSLLIVLLTRFGLPFTILSTTVVVVQFWLSRSSLGQAYEPYPLYAVSNVGSLIGLISYAFFIEPMTGLKTQSLVWTMAYIVLIILMSIIWYLLRDHQAREPNTSEKGFGNTFEKGPGPSKYGAWILLSSLPSALLLSISSFISMEIGSFPMVWIMPLALYLCSFMVTFRTNGGVPKLLYILWPEILLLASIFYFMETSSLYAIFGCLLAFGIICLLAHGTLYEIRPPARWLTNFYLTLAVGGFVGGATISLLAPFIFKRYLEYLILLLAFGVTFGWFRDKSFKKFWTRTSRLIVVGRVIFIIIILARIGLSVSGYLKEDVKFRHRNFYGTYQVFDIPFPDSKIGSIRILTHGKTLHGAQFVNPSLQMTPVMYYYRGSGFSDIYETTPRPFRTAVIGLGAGVICAFAKPEDLITFFEIDPDNYEIAKRWFTYLKNCKGRVNVITGDGRLSLKNYGDGTKFDIITVDAFSGDGIPIHLLTKEAFEVYLSRLAEDGVILFHISSRYYHLRPVIKSISATLNLFGVMNLMVPHERLAKYQLSSNLVVVAREPKRLQALIDRGWIKFSEKDGLPKIKPWTDDHIDIVTPFIEVIKNVGLY